MLSAIGLGTEVVVEHASECRPTGGNDTRLVFNKADR